MSERSLKLKLIYRYTHRDYRGTVDGVKSILVLREGGTTLVPLTALTDAEVADLWPYAERKEAEHMVALAKLPKLTLGTDASGRLTLKPVKGR